MRLVLLLVLLGACASPQEKEERREIERLRRELGDARFWVEEYVERFADAVYAPGARKWLRRMEETPIEDLGAEDLRTELEAAHFWLGRFRERVPYLPEPKSPPGRVLEVNDRKVRISIGSKDGVEVGDTYQLRRGATYVGQMTVTKVEKEVADGEFDQQFVGKGAPPQPGDVAEPRGW